MINVSNVAVKRPPITTVANGRCTSAPAEADTAIGKKPSMAAVAVSKIGRIRSFVPKMILLFMSVTPSCLSELKRLISTSPLSTATPNNTIKPTPAEMEKDIPRKAKAKTPPIVASGTAM